MANKNHPSFDAIYKSNLDLLELTKQEKWDEFTVLAESYIIALQYFVEGNGKNLTPEDKEQLKEVWNVLLENEQQMVSKLNSRLEVLKKQMSSLRQGNKCSKAYSSQMLSAYH